MAKEVTWTGRSGTKYKYFVYTLDQGFKAVAGNYIFVKETDKYHAIYIGETSDLDERLSNHDELPCIKRNGGNSVHVHGNDAGEAARRAEEKDLIDNYNPPCNR